MAKEKKAKAVNYTAEQVAIMRARYTGADNKTEVAAIAAALGKTTNSVRAKLASEGVYVPEPKATPKGKDANKTAIAEKIAEAAGLGEHEIEGLAKATKGALEKVLAALTNG